MNSAGTLLLIWAVLHYQDGAATTPTIQCRFEAFVCNHGSECHMSCTIIRNNSESHNCTCVSHSSMWEGLLQVWEFLKQPSIHVAFIAGLLLSALVCGCDRRCRRKKQRRKNFETGDSGEVTTTHAIPLVDGQPAEPREVEYSAIDFSRWSRKPPASAADKPPATETDYAELQKGGCREGTAEGLGDTAGEVEVQVEAELEEEVAVEMEEKQEAAANEDEK